MSHLCPFQSLGRWPARWFPEAPGTHPWGKKIKAGGSSRTRKEPRPREGVLRSRTAQAEAAPRDCGVQGKLTKAGLTSAHYLDGREASTLTSPLPGEVCSEYSSPYSDEVSGVGGEYPSEPRPCPLHWARVSGSIRATQSSCPEAGTPPPLSTPVPWGRRLPPSDRRAAHDGAQEPRSPAASQGGGRSTWAGLARPGSTLRPENLPGSHGGGEGGFGQDSEAALV